MSIQDAVLACVMFGNRPPTDPRSVAALVAIRTSLATVYSTLARGIANHPNYRNWEADASNPGYLLTRIDSFELRVPWNLVSDFPTSTSLRGFLAEASKLKVRSDSVLCLSGSLLSLGTVQDIADIDLCEYVLDTSCVFSDVARQAIETALADVTCLEVKAYATRALEHAPEIVDIRRPWSADAIEAFLAGVKDSPIGKCDFISMSSPEGAIEITKTVLHVDRRYPDTEGPWDLSFAYQEAAVAADCSWTPRRLASPSSLGRYVVWLYRQVLTHADSAPAKAAKRALALARVLYMPALAEAAAECLQKDDLALKNALKARIELHGRLNADATLRPFRAGVETAIARLAARLRGGDRYESTRDGLEAAEIAEISNFLARSAHTPNTVGALVARFTDLLEPAVRVGRY